jgi:DNA adenine methylase
MWSYSVKKPSKYIANKKDAFVEAYAERLKYVQLECDDALRVIKTRDKVDTFFYIDPPYFNSDMGHYGDYNARDFEDLLSLLSQLKGKFLLSSYPSELLTKYTEQNGWHTQTIELAIATSSKGKKKMEVLTANYAI